MDERQYTISHTGISCLVVVICQGEAVVNKIPEKSEHKQQVHIFKFAELMESQYPELRLLNGSLNGVRLTIGQAKKAKAAGMKAGYPDIFLPVSRQGYHGLFIELKKQKGGRLTTGQRRWLMNLQGQGYYACVAKGADAAKEVLIKYVRGEIE